MAKRVCVRSSINVDEFFEVEHIVLSGETLASTSYSRRPGGKGANCATAIAKGSKTSDAVDFCGTINSQDGFLRETLHSYGVGASRDTLKESDSEPTGRAIIQVSTSTADNSILLFPGCNFAEYQLPSALKERYSHMLVQNEIPIEQTCGALQAAKEQGLTTIFNPSPIPPKDVVSNVIAWKNVDWLVLNHEESKSLAGIFGHDVTTVDPLDALSKSMPHATGIVVTKGGDGVEALLADGNGGFVRLSSPAGKVLSPIKDTTGAGDTFTGYLVASLLRLDSDLPSKTELQEILRLASAAATACCEKNGAMEAIPNLAQVLDRLD